MSTANLTDEAGGLAHSYRYDAWGRMRDQAGTSDNPRQYTSHYKDDETGLHYFGARYYDDETGRFLSQDPYLGEANTPPSLHRYLYAYANPLQFVDLTGYAAQDKNKPLPMPPGKSGKEEVIPELANTVIGPDGKHYDAAWSDRIVIAENKKDLARIEERLEGTILSKKKIDRIFEDALKRAEKAGIKQIPGVYEEYIYHESGGPLRNLVLGGQIVKFRTENGQVIGYKAWSGEDWSYYDLQGKYTPGGEIGVESEGIGPFEYIALGKSVASLGISLSRRLLGQVATKASTKLLSKIGVEAVEDGPWLRMSATDLTDDLLPANRLTGNKLVDLLEQKAKSGEGIYKYLHGKIERGTPGAIEILKTYKSGALFNRETFEMFFGKNPSRVEVIEEFTHFLRQVKYKHNLPEYAEEIATKDFMLRHQKVLGLDVPQFVRALKEQIKYYKNQIAINAGEVLPKPSEPTSVILKKTIK
jgi:RHS repeat-associated protein